MASSSARRRRARVQRRRAASMPAERRQALAEADAEELGSDESDERAEPAASGFLGRLLGGSDRDGEASADGPRWGLGDVLGGWAVSIVASAVAFVVYASVSGLPEVLPTTGFEVGYALAREQLELPRQVFRSLYDTDIGVRSLLQIPLWIGLAGAPLWAAWRKGTSLREDFGWRFEARDVPVGLAIGVAAQAAVVGIYALLAGILDGDAAAEPARDVVDSATGPLGFLLLLAVVGVGAPVVEELFYRGLTQRSLLKRGVAPRWAILITAVFFAANHLQSILFPALVLAGVLFGVLAHRTGRLGLAVFAHVGFNTTTVVVLSGLTPLAI